MKHDLEHLHDELPSGVVVVVQDHVVHIRFLELFLHIFEKLAVEPGIHRSVGHISRQKVRKTSPGDKGIVGGPPGCV